MKIGILNADKVRPELVDHFGEYPDMFGNLLLSIEPGIEIVVYDVISGDYPEKMDEVHGYIITGSKMSVYDEIDWIKQLGEFVQELHKKKKKLIGICFGHQLVAHFLGGKTQKSDKGWGIGIHESILSSSAEHYGVEGQNYNLVCSHQDQIVEPAPSSVILASSEFCPYSMLQIEDHILTFQGHPEFSKDFSRSLLDLRKNDFDENTYQEGLDSLTKNTDAHEVGKWIVNFIKGNPTSHQL